MLNDIVDQQAEGYRWSTGWFYVLIDMLRYVIDKYVFIDNLIIDEKGVNNIVDPQAKL